MRGASRIVTGALAALLLASTAAGSTIEQAAVDLEQPADAATRLRRGEMLRSEPEEDSERELAVGLTFLVHKPPADVLQAFLGGSGLEGRRPARERDCDWPARRAPDFAGLVPEPGRAAEVERYLVASPGDTLNLSADEIEAFHSLASPGNGFEPQVEEQLKRVLLARHRAYLQRGLAGMAPYARPSGPFEPSGELRTRVPRIATPTAPRAGDAAPAALVSGGSARGTRGALLLAPPRARRPSELRAPPSAGDPGRRFVGHRRPRILREPRLQHVAGGRPIDPGTRGIVGRI